MLITREVIQEYMYGIFGNRENDRNESKMRRDRGFSSSDRGRS